MDGYFVVLEGGGAADEPHGRPMPLTKSIPQGERRSVRGAAEAIQVDG